MITFEAPTMHGAERVTDAWTMLPSWLPVPGMGVLPVNSFLLKGREPMLVDTGLGLIGDDFLAALASEIDPGDLRWIWISHMDADHAGNLARVLAAAPNARVVTNFLNTGRLNMAGFDIGRVQMLEPGTAFEAGGRRLIPVRPPYYESPGTLGFYDAHDRALFAVDSFGALLPAPVREIDELPDGALRDGLIGWSSVDAPWLAAIDNGVLARTLKSLEAIDPAVILSGHLPPVRGGIRRLTSHLAAAYDAPGNLPADPEAIEHLAATLNAELVPCS